MSKPETSAVTFTKNDVEIIARETLYSGFFARTLPFSSSFVQW
jgi:ADP-ribose pyrophosphatase